ncbi:hypothetical protein [Azospirillum agricola]|uniref:hypothetical protein n=1 Tax=Azospirillum agricola TaxID=1720247 RepID=UPI000A1CC1F7|nr:hypothetical protein [Azospirillum agricola]
MTDEQRERVVRTFIPALEAHLEPADGQWINGRVAALLAHYYVPDMPMALQVATLGDWITLLSRFPQWAIEAAVDEWLDRPGRQRPMPGDIADACRWRIAEPALNLRLLRKLVNARRGQA